jgi:hypothetical protein
MLIEPSMVSLTPKSWGEEKGEGGNPKSCFNNTTESPINYNLE